MSDQIEPENAIDLQARKAKRQEDERAYFIQLLDEVVTLHGWPWVKERLLDILKPYPDAQEAILPHIFKLDTVWNTYESARNEPGESEE